MTLDAPNLHLQSTQHGSSSTHSRIADDNYSGFLNARHVRCELSTCFARLFAAVKEYFRPAPPPIHEHANHTLVDRNIDEESPKDFDFEQNDRYQSPFSTTKQVALLAAAAGIATAVYLARSAFHAHGDVVEQELITSDALSATLAATALIGRRLLSAPTVTNGIANQSVFANASFNLQIDLSQVFNYTENLGDVHFSQLDGTPLPSWLTTAITPTFIGSIEITFAYAVAVVGNYAYAADHNGLKIIDVSDKASPALIGNIYTSVPFGGVAVVDNYAYVADLTGLKIIDVSYKASPVLTGSAAMTGQPRGISVVGNYAYVAGDTPGLKIIDVSNKAIPILIGSIATSSASGVTVVDNYAYIADGSGGLKIIDVGNKASPTLVGNISTSSASGVTVIDNYAYVADQGDGLKIINVSNKASPALIGSIATKGASSVTLVGNYAYVADYFGGLKIIDVSNKTSPALIGSIAIGGGAGGYASPTFVDNYAYITNEISLMIFSLNKISLSGTPAPLNRGTLPIQLTITDALGETASTRFWITVLNHPPIAPIIAPQIVHRAFNWTIPAFSDLDGDSLTYSATLADGSLLPNWITFNPTTRYLSGVVPPVVAVRNVNIQANDAHEGIANGIQTINVVNTAPIVGPSALPSQNIKSTVPFTFSFNSTVFIDPDGDPLIYSVAPANQQPLPKWLGFNQTQTGGIFTGIASAESAGSLSVIVAATDPFGAIISRSFTLNVAAPNNNNTPPVTLSNPPDYSVGINKQISFQISSNTFFDADNDVLTYTASTVGGSALPVWLSFDGDTRFFSGTAPNTPQILPINVLAEDWHHIPATANFNLFVEETPQVLAPLSNLVANVGTPFKFVVPENTFQNPGIQNAMTWSASLTTGAPLPAWLTFDPVTRTFNGTPGRKDTDAFSSKPLPIRLMAANNIATASVDFIINVQGESDATLAIKIVSGVGTALTIGGIVYAKRHSIWKRNMKCVYRLPTDHIVFGRESEYCHTITRLKPDKVASVKLLKNGQFLPEGMSLPKWLLYDRSSAKLTINATALKEQEGLFNSQWTVQVRNQRGCVNHLVWEEFDIKFVTQHPDSIVEDELRSVSDSIVMKPFKTSQDQLREPLIG